MTHPQLGKTAIYRLYDASGQLLYLGLANDPERRWEEHSRSKFWWHLVARKEVAWYASREEAGRVEEEATASERPKHDMLWRRARANGVAWVPRPEDPFYAPLLATLRAGLEDGSYPDGHILRDDWDTANRFGVSVCTLTHALGTLVQEFRMRTVHEPKNRTRVRTYKVETWQPAPLVGR